MKILTVKRLPVDEKELNLLKEMFEENIIINLQDDDEIEPLGFRTATSLEVRFLDEMKTLLEKNNEGPVL